ncbi:MAG TPA: hypothetical protein VNA15_10245 [Candidatus Angelobacter sp.]|nr:hypothetical protein [Candidatus Angelobacter sp.]
MQAPKKHLPIVGILGLIAVAAAGGGVYYYQFILSHASPALTPSHRLVIINATVVENSAVAPNGHGFEIKNTAYLNQSTLPSFDVNSGPNMTGVKFTNYQGNSDNSTINANPGDTITFYIYAVSASQPPQVAGILGHGFSISPTPDKVIGGPIPGVINFGHWYSVTATFTNAGTYLYSCTIFCSNGHPNMHGNIVVG